MLHESRQYVFFKTTGTFRNILESCPLKYVHASIHQARLLNSQLFAETNYTILAIDLDSAVSCCVRHPANRDARPSPVLLVETEQLLKIKLQKRVAVHYQEVRSSQEKIFRLLYRARRSKGAGFSRVLDCYIPLVSITQRFFYLLGLKAGTHNKPADSL